MPTDPTRIKAIFLEAAELPDDSARAAYLDRACGADAGLRERVEALFRSHDPAGSFLGTPVAVIPDPDFAGTVAFSPAPDHATTRTGGESPSDDEVPLGFLAPATRPDSLGRIGHYEVLQVIGQGGFGIVFRAFDEVLHRVVAVKVLAPQLAATSPARKRFLREARSSAQVRHENVVQVYEVGETPLPYIAMEFIPGETLQERLKRVGPVDAVEVVRVGRQVAEGLAAAHATDLIHRDIKPGNILLEGGAGRVKITDFGLARAADDASISQSGIIAGTPMYMAPEQALGAKLDQRADLFSLGSVLYQMACGRPPFRANGTVAVLKRVAEDTPRSIREIVPETPQWLCDIIAKLHAKNPDDRYQSAREVADVLADCEAQLKANSKLKDFSRIPQRALPKIGFGKRVIVSSFIWLCLVGLVAIIAGLYFNKPESKPKDDSASAVPVPPTPPIQVVTQGPTFKNSIGMEFVVVPKGKSWLGGGKDKLGDKEVEIPADFYLGKYEVTQEEWEKVMGENPSYFSRTSGGMEAVKDIADADLKRFPVESVSWDQCQVFVAKLNQREKEVGWVYRLPTELEREYACRGGPMADKADSAFDFYFAKPTNTLLAEQANFKDSGPNRTCKAGSYKPNKLGLYDMHGNVREWSADEVPADPKEPEGATRRVAQGGGWHHDSGYCRAASSIVITPATRYLNLGLRLARVPSGAPSPEVKTPPLAVAPFTDADVKRIAALPAAEQVEEVRKELMQRNPGFDGEMETTIENGVVTEFRIVTDTVTDITPIRVFKALRTLDCSGTWTNNSNGLLADLTPLKAMNLAALTHLGLACTKVTDAGMVYFKDCKDLKFLRLDGTTVTDTGLAHFKDCKDLTLLRLDATRVTDTGLAQFKDCKDLTYLNLSWTKVSDVGLAHFKDCKDLTSLLLCGTKVDDAGLAHFKGMPLKLLWIDYTAGITDLNGLQGMPLEDVRLTPKNITKGLKLLRDMKTLKTIGIGELKAWPAAEFWERYDKGEFKE